MPHGMRPSFPLILMGSLADLWAVRPPRPVFKLESVSHAFIEQGSDTVVLVQAE